MKYPLCVYKHLRVAAEVLPKYDIITVRTFVGVVFWSVHSTQYAIHSRQIEKKISMPKLNCMIQFFL